jgi:uncharacterized membrane protein
MDAWIQSVKDLIIIAAHLMYVLLLCPQLTTTVHVDVQLRVSECSTCEL